MYGRAPDPKSPSGRPGSEETRDGSKEVGVDAHARRPPHRGQLPSATLSGGLIAPAVGREEHLDAPHASAKTPNEKRSVGDHHGSPPTHSTRRRHRREGDCFGIAALPMPKLERTSSAIGGVKGVSRARKSDPAESGDDHSGGDLQPYSGEETTSYEGEATEKDPYCWGGPARGVAGGGRLRVAESMHSAMI